MANTITRRDFLKTAASAAGAAAVPWIVPARALGRDGATAPSNRVTVACIGWGQMGPQDLMAMIQFEDVQVAAVCDLDRPRREDACAVVDRYYASKHRAGGCRPVHDFRELLARPDLDAVIVATPDHWHAPLVCAAAAAGKDIYCEKPLSLTVREGREMIGAVRRHGRILQVGSQQRSMREFLQACELVRNGMVGKLHTIRIGLPRTGGIVQPEWTFEPQPVPGGLDYEMWQGPAPEAPYTKYRVHVHYRWIFDYSGGMMADWGAHHFDIAHWGMDTELSGPISVEGTAVFPKHPIYDTPFDFHLEYGYANGVRMIVDTMYDCGVKFEGSEGWVYVERDRIEASPDSLLGAAIPANGVRLYRSRIHQRNFIDCVRSRAEPIGPVEVGHHSVNVGHVGNICLRLGRKLRWDPELERFQDDAEANRLLSREMRAPWQV